MHNSPYFTKLDRLLYDIKLIELSYISENMINKTELITILLDKMENYKSLSVEFFGEKIFWYIDNDEI